MLNGAGERKCYRFKAFMRDVEYPLYQKDWPQNNMARYSQVIKMETYDQA